MDKAIHLLVSWFGSKLSSAALRKMPSSERSEFQGVLEVPISEEIALNTLLGRSFRSEFCAEVKLPSEFTSQQWLPISLSLH